MTMMETQQLTKTQAADAGFATFNGGNHLCVKMDGKHNTVTVITPFGKKVTFAFMNWNNGDDGHVECVDIQQHGDGEELRKQKVAVMGQGPTYYTTKDDPVTLVVLDLK